MLQELSVQQLNMLNDNEPFPGFGNLAEQGITSPSTGEIRLLYALTTAGQISESVAARCLLHIPNKLSRLIVAHWNDLPLNLKRHPTFAANTTTSIATALAKNHYPRQDQFIHYKNGLLSALTNMLIIQKRAGYPTE